MSTLKPVTHVIFDMDGLLLDTEALYTLATERVLKPFGKEFTWDLKVAQMGQKAEVCAKIITSKLGIKLSVEDYLKQVSQIHKEIMPSAKVLPGADKLVQHLHKHKIPIAIASGGAQDSFELKTTNHKELVSKFSHVVLASTDSEVKNGKPAPDVFLVCADRFPDKPKPEQCLVFEDAPNGVAAGVAAGMQVVMVPDPRMKEEMTKGASLVLKSLEDFKPELFGLPPYDA
ncbi:pseudouridine-5'-phosphatase-like isoform X5 [Penaeus japonicus]|uniref:pseudouridine-5'-phosphatase-like isoform X5 n=1 Tax=Penaeus japonicus TaxID=27405 RepID=UPI001C715176|nr:pseudouridine-5'-phosphatase-like isoform X5 [Penaeus japonicus]